MRHFKKYFVFLFIFSLFIASLHELSPNHPHDDSCEICLVAHTPTLLTTALVLLDFESYFEPFYSFFSTPSYQARISVRSRSPPLS